MTKQKHVTVSYGMKRYIGPAVGRRGWAQIQRRKYGPNWKQHTRALALAAV